MVVPDHRHSLSGRREYNYVYAASTKDIPRKFVGAPNKSTTSVDGELTRGGNIGDVISMSVQNMDTLTLQLSHDSRIEKGLIYVMSVPKLVEEATDVQAHWDLSVHMSIWTKVFERTTRATLREDFSKDF